MKSPYGIDHLEERRKEATAKQLDGLKKECSLYAQCFNTPAGIKIMAIMKKMLEDQPTWNPDVDPRYGYYREGQNDVLRHITNRVNFMKESK